jgi:plasmid stability protein
VATLNIKNFPGALYRKLKARARQERRSMAQEVTRLLEKALEESEPLSILDMEGLGEVLWRNEDVAEHVGRERDSWDD